MSGPDLAAEVTRWLEGEWDPDLDVAAWWERLADAGWSIPTWPQAWGGLGCSPAEGAQILRAIVAHEALGPPGGLGMMLAGPTLLAHADDDVKERYLRDVATGRAAWCQLFSEPAAGSDLAAVQTRAMPEGDVFRVTGQKVWTSSAHLSDFGMLLARTDPDAPKHRGLTYFVVDMRQPGIDIRPLRELTGRAFFNEVFLTDVEIHRRDVVGKLGDGWAAANTTLAFERSAVSTGGAAASAALPGTIAGHLERRSGDLAAKRERRRSGVHAAASADFLAERAVTHGRAAEPGIRQELARLYTEQEVSRYLALRQRSLRRAGGDLPGFANIAKLRMSEELRMAATLGTRIVGPHGMLHDYDRGSTDPSDGPAALTLWAPAPAIYGGTDQIQRNILGERVLGLPREPAEARGRSAASPAPNG